MSIGSSDVSNDLRPAVVLHQCVRPRLSCLATLKIPPGPDLLDSVRYQRSHLSRARFRGAGDLAAARLQLAGRLKRKIAPRGEFFIAQSFPPWASMIEREIASPIPIPLGFVV